ncbi:hypothetical protein Poli38472_002049 [Pythium oligandrum]|uniref:Uncharacterized protein n=1 Tax=Pythium oligandrum TaxID=41045 RepID=A0A8K1CHJ8_PYTOL|nr:hypothetical protein Poli38472_002049 [Pythium oligandrum]|eukprot:TMW63108.1 hypothetical protein Poli38472_002049 [Pythium oligandrum]
MEGYSHCRCLQHQARLKRRCDGEASLPDKDGCLCFSGRWQQTKDNTTSDAAEKRQQMRSLKRKIGIPSSANVYRRKIVADDDGSDCSMDSSDDGAVSRDVDDVIHSRMFQPWIGEYSTQAPQRPLNTPNRLAPTSYLESIDPRRGLPRLHPRVAGNTIASHTIDRTLENALYMQARDQAMPSEELVDFLVYAASMKISRVPELVGTMDDTAATALGVVVEEFTKQVVVDHLLSNRVVCPPSREAVQAFATMILKGFNWLAYLRAAGYESVTAIQADAKEKILRELVQLIYESFQASQRPQLVGPSTTEREAVEICSWLRGTVEVELTRMICHHEAGHGNQETQQEQGDGPTWKLGAHNSRVTGRPVYRADISGDVGTHHQAQVVIDALETIEQAKAAVQRVISVLKTESDRLERKECPPEPPIPDPIVEELYGSLQQQVEKFRATRSSARNATAQQQEPPSNGAPKG